MIAWRAVAALQLRPHARGCALSAAIGLAVPAAFLCAVWVACGLSWWSRIFILGCVVATLGALARALLITRGTRLIVFGGVLAVSPWLVRALTVHGTDSVTLLSLPDGKASGPLSRMYPESDGVLASGTLIAWAGLMRDPETRHFSQILQRAYARAAPAAESVPTPAINTYLGRQSPRSFEAMVIRPPQIAPAEAALIFLHGYAGNFYVYCGEVAQAAAGANLLTVCPSTDASGAWWTQRGQETLQATLEYVQTLGVQRVYLAGLSNGAAGAATLAKRFEHRLSGLVLVSGVSRAQPTELPTLVIQGRSDEMMTPEHARAYAAGRANVSYHELKGGHLILFTNYLEVRPLIATFLGELEHRAREH